MFHQCFTTRSRALVPLQVNPRHADVTEALYWTLLLLLSLMDTPQDRDSHQHRQSSRVYIYIYILNICTFITLYLVLYHLCLKLQKKKPVQVNVRVFLYHGSLFLLPLPVSLPFYWKSWKHYRGVFLLFRNSKKWRFPLLRNPEMWKSSIIIMIIIIKSVPVESLVYPLFFWTHWQHLFFFLA